MVDRIYIDNEMNTNYRSQLTSNAQEEHNHERRVYVCQLSVVLEVTEYFDDNLTTTKNDSSFVFFLFFVSNLITELAVIIDDRFRIT